MFSSIKIMAVGYSIASLLLIAISNPENAFSQSSSDKSVDISGMSENSPYYFGVLSGYTRIFEGSKLAENAKATDFVHGVSIGFSFDYKLPGTSSFIQFLTENNSLNFNNNEVDNFQTLRFTTIGLKYHPKIIKDLFMTVGTGILTGSDIETRMIMSFALGYDIITGKNCTTFIQIGTYGTDFNDNIILFRFGVRLNL